MDWRKLSIWLLASSIVLCGWCNIISLAGGWLMGYDLGQREARAALLPDTGVLVTRVERGGPAASAGIGRGDTIIAINGVRITDVPMLRNEILRYEPEQEINITYRTNLNELTAVVELGVFPGANSPLPYLGIYYTARAEPPADV
jgi:PDZ domain-containing secreted protein